MPKLQNKPPEVARDRNGRVLPGHTANPGGRPKVWREFQEAMRERSPEALRRIDEALGSKDPALYQWAAEKVLAYARAGRRSGHGILQVHQRIIAKRIEREPSGWAASTLGVRAGGPPQKPRAPSCSP
jgi:hypothetical protein